MKIIFIPFCIAFILGFTSCEQCYECSTDLPILVNDVEVGTTPFTNTECGRGTIIKDKVDALEENDYTCVKQ